MTQTQVAHMLGISRSCWASIEHDPLSVTVGQLMEILCLLDAQLMLRMSEAPDRRRETHKLTIGWKQRSPRGRW